MSFFGKMLAPMAGSFFRKAPAIFKSGAKSFFSKTPTLSQVSAGLDKASNVSNKLLSSPLADVLASQVKGGDKVLNTARRASDGLGKAREYTDDAANVLEKVRQAIPRMREDVRPVIQALPPQFGRAMMRY